MISRELLEELQQIMNNDYNLGLSLEDTEEVGNMLVTFFGTLLEIEKQRMEVQEEGGGENEAKK